MYTFLRHLELAGGRRWKKRIQRWRRRGATDPMVQLRTYARGLDVDTAGGPGQALYQLYRHAQMDYNVERDSGLDRALYERRRKVRADKNSRGRARSAYRSFHRLSKAAMAGKHVHHVDCNPRNNDMRNLQLLTPEAHRKIRCSRRARKGLRVPENVAMAKLWRSVYYAIKKTQPGEWSARHTKRLVDDYRAGGGTFTD